MCQTDVAVNYNVTDYLPPDTALDRGARRALGGVRRRHTERALHGADVSLPEALEIKERLAAVPGVEAVTWLDDAADVLAPLETQDKRTVRRIIRTAPRSTRSPSPTSTG